MNRTRSASDFRVFESNRGTCFSMHVDTTKREYKLPASRYKYNTGLRRVNAINLTKLVCS